MLTHQFKGLFQQLIFNFNIIDNKKSIVGIAIFFMESLKKIIKLVRHLEMME